jgi:uncharacterized membrane protein
MTDEHTNQSVHHGSVENDHTKTHSGGNPIAVFSYLWILIIIPFLTDSKHDPFVKFHLKQGLALLIFDVIGWIVAALIGWIPVIGWLITSIWSIASIILIIIGIINVLQGKEKDLPLIGHYAHSFNF